MNLSNNERAEVLNNNDREMYCFCCFTIVNMLESTVYAVILQNNNSRAVNCILLYLHGNGYTSKRVKVQGVML